MKTAIANSTLILSLLGCSLVAADPASAPSLVEQEFQQVDVQLAIEQYKRIRMAAFDVVFKLETEETTLSDEQRNRLENTYEKLLHRADELRASTIKKAAAATTP